MVIYLKKQLNTMTYPMIFLSSFVILESLLSYAGINANGAENAIFSLAAPAFAVYYSTKTAKKALAAGFCVLSADYILFASASIHFSLVFSLFCAFISVLIFDKLNLIFGFYSLLIILVLLSSAFALTYEYFYEGEKALCSFLSEKGAIFGMVNQLWELFISNDLAELMYHKSYSGTLLTEQGIISGAIDIFKADKNASVASLYLSGKYFINIFFSLGVFAAVYSKLDEKAKIALITALAASVIFGKSELFMLFILIFNPVIFAAGLFVTFVSYFVSELLSLGIGFTENASVIELIKYGNKWGYFILCGLIISVLSYFISIIILEKYDLCGGKFFPKAVKNIVSALGGEENILSLKGCNVIVSNPNLIDILRLDCDIRENKVTLLYDDAELLKEYI